MLCSELITTTLELSKRQRSCALSEDYLQDALLQIMPQLTEGSIVIHPDWISLSSYQLRKGVFVILKYDFFKPVFGRLTDIAVMEKTVMLCVFEYYDHSFNEHFNSFEITHHGVYKAVSLDLLQDHRPVYAKQSFVNTEKKFIYHCHIYNNKIFVQGIVSPVPYKKNKFVNYTLGTFG